MSSSMAQILSYTSSKSIINWEVNFPRIHHAEMFFKNISNLSILMMVQVTAHRIVFSSILVLCLQDTRIWRG